MKMILVVVTTFCAILVADPVSSQVIRLRGTVDDMSHLSIAQAQTYFENNGKCYRCGLRGVNFRGATLIRPDLKEADLADANFNEAFVNEADLASANLTGAILSNGYHIRSNFSGANLSGADLSGARMFDTNLANSNLEHANLNGASFVGANLAGTNFRDANLANIYCKTSPTTSTLNGLMALSLLHQNKEPWRNGNINYAGVSICYLDNLRLQKPILCIITSRQRILFEKVLKLIFAEIF